MAKNNPDQLITEIIQFLKNERELYGNFAISNNASQETPELGIAYQDSDTGEQAQSQASSKAIDPNQKNSSMDGFDAQEKLFNQNDDREIYREIANCKNLEELEELCQKAEVLHTDLPDTNLVFGVGNPHADLMLIGEAPGAEEDKQGEPFVGAAGQLLNKILEAIDFNRDDVYIANILKHRPPNNRNPLPEERKRSLPFLLRQIDLIEPKLILCLGKVSAQTLLDNDNTLSSMRGTFHPFRGKYELMATYHPAALLRHSNWKRPTWEDVQLLRERYDELGCKP